MAKMRFAILGAVALLAALALPAAANDVIYSGIDTWRTPADGSTFVDFSHEPLPAGFFCGKSAAFTGKVPFKGVPIVTEGGSLGPTDTIVERLDDVTLDENGVGTTRVQLRALQFESIAPVKTACGKFNVRVHLDGEQPITEMRIVKENETGGRFFAHIGLRARVIFTPVRGQARRPMEVVREVRFQPSSRAPWSLRPSDKAVQRMGFVQVDTDADGTPDAFLPGTSNFAAGASMDKSIVYYVCHDDPNCGVHCQQVVGPTIEY
ncbi:MAG TPA: hypothetical protein VEL74_23685 [Thermoanaerobaculia bacterium]|nr:hypothetical protein [Thermoanaerobaculia bacterium]